MAPANRDRSAALRTTPADHSLQYTETLMYGHYSTLRNFARTEAAKYKTTTEPLSTDKRKLIPKRLYSWSDVLFGRFVQDWVFLTILGFTVAVFSFAIDVIVENCLAAYRYTYLKAGSSLVTQYLVWVSWPLVFIWFSTGFTHIVAPSAIGSGIPEVKTIMKGVVLKECLTLRTLIAKVIGLTTALASTMPLGKLGPFVHLASVTGAVLAKLFKSMRHELENESRNIDILTAAAAVGVSSTFACPIGGVLFSIEATATYFAVRNYWRGFYAAMCGAITFRMLGILFLEEGNQAKVTALFLTNLRHDAPYHPSEIISFCIVGSICGAFGALFVYTHKNTVLFIRKQKRLSAFLQRNRFIYPTVITLAVSSCLFPPGLGKYMAGHLALREAVNMLFDNRTWSSHEAVDIVDTEILEIWRGPLNNVYLTIFLFFIMRFWMCATATTMPVPCGIFIPAFTLGASAGRLMGEIMASWFPLGIGGHAIIPAAYSIVGAAAFSGAMTHTVSTAIIVFELTGQMGHILPCVLAVMVANVTAHYLQPSVYDAMIIIKRLPFLPSSIDPDVCNAHTIYAEDFMTRDLQFLTINSTYAEAYHLIHKLSFRSFPLVDSKENMLLLGAVQRKELKRVIRAQFSEQRRLEYFADTTQHSLSSQLYSAAASDVSKPFLAQCHRTNLPDTQQTREIKVRRPSGTFHRFSISQASPASPASASAAAAAAAAPQQRAVHRFSVSRAPEPNPLNTPAYKSPPTITITPPSDFKAIDETDSPTSKQDLEWELHQLRQPIDFEECCVDPAPFQIMDTTSLYKVHSLFTLLSLHHTFVTSNSRLVGIISLTEVRKATQGEIDILPLIKKKIKEEKSAAKK